MIFNRSSGILLHLTSLPGQFGIGDLGSSAHRWLEFLAGAGCSLWQILPLGPTGYGDSPYQCFSSFAGNPLLISIQNLIDESLLDADEIHIPSWKDDTVDYGSVYPWKGALLDQAYHRFNAHAHHLSSEFDSFRKKQAFWLEDFTLFMALKEQHAGASWLNWEVEYRDRQPGTITKALHQLAPRCDSFAFQQFLFFRQWNALHKKAKSLGIQIIGDLPIYVALDSCDVWSNRSLFYLDQQGNPSVVAGVPPDYFSPTGQLWGNPLYIWKSHKAQDFEWWQQRIASLLDVVDIVRLDHFRGFAGYWEIPGKAPTAEKGRWVSASGKHLLETLQKRLGNLPLIAEDLGVITPDVVALREAFSFPGMKILQFAFSGNPQNPFLPHTYTQNCVVYTGTHDNDTTLGWYQRVEQTERDFALKYLSSDGREIAWDLIRAAWASVAVFAIAPLQDFLSLDNQARMNYPGRLGGNWSWRVDEDTLSTDLQKRISEINFIFGRMNTGI
jgi:4-alpha-glucanotransferase